LEDIIRTEILGKAEHFSSVGEWENALELLKVENDRNPDAVLEQNLIDFRIRAFRESKWPAPDVAWPPHHKPLPVQGSELPEISPEALNVETLRSGILGNGGLIVRGLMDEDTVNTMRGNIDRTLVARQGGAGEKGGVDRRSWYTRSSQVKGGPAQFFALGGANQILPVNYFALHIGRLFFRTGGAIC